MVIPIKKLLSGSDVVGLSEFQSGDVIPSEYIPSRDNLIINGDFSVAQRGTSFTSATWRTNANDSYLLDRWLLLSDGNDIVDVTQIASPFSRSRYALQAEVETANKKFGFCQIIEANTCIPLRGQKVSVSFAVKTVTSKVINNVRVAVLEWTSTADTVTSDVVANWASNLTFATNWAALNTPANLALTTSEQTFKVENLTVGASCNNLAVFVWVDDTDCAVDDILQLGEVQVVRGSVVPEFVATDDYNNCLPFCEKSYNKSVTPGTSTDAGAVANVAVSTAYMLGVVFACRKRATSTISIFSINGVANKATLFDTGLDPSSMSLSVGGLGESGFYYLSDGTNYPFTAGKGYSFQFIAEAEL